MTAYKVLSVGEPQEWQGTHGPMHCYRLMLEGVEKPVEINQKPTTAAPVVGETLDLELSDNLKYPAVMKGKKIAPAGGFGGGGAGRDDHPKKSAAMGRAHAQEMALKYCVAKANTDFTWEQLVVLIDKFEADVVAARERA